MKLEKPLIGIGYWRSYEQPFLPDPGIIKNEYISSNEIKNIVSTLKSAKHISFPMMGFSWCRFRCGTKNIGNNEFTNGKYIWPEGLLHYVKEHKIILPDVFIKSISNEYYEFEGSYTIDFNYWIEYCKNNKIGNDETFKSEFDIGHLFLKLNTQLDDISLINLNNILKELNLGAALRKILNKLNEDGYIEFIIRCYDIQKVIGQFKNSAITVKFTELTFEEFNQYKEGKLLNGQITY